MKRVAELELSAFLLIAIQLLLFLFGVLTKSETSAFLVIIAMCIIGLKAFFVKTKLDDLKKVK